MDLLVEMKKGVLKKYATGIDGDSGRHYKTTYECDSKYVTLFLRMLFYFEVCKKKELGQKKLSPFYF